MPDDYYRNILYPLQDKILAVIAALPVDFYLTGGTALSRCYLNHRFSDDLDFFVNGSENFKPQLELILKSLSDHNITHEISTISNSFVRLIVKEQQHILKIDFINDINVHFGNLESCPFFPRVDNPLNILSNKICAVSRYEAKDISDILSLSIAFSFSWEDIINEAKEKDIWVNPLEVSKIIYEFPVEKLEFIKWIEPIDTEIAEKQLKQIARDILKGNTNSLGIK